MDPISRATLPNIIPATPKVGQAGALAPVSPTATANLAIPLISSTLVDISPLGQFLSGVALSRRQLLALQGATDEASQGATPVNRDADLLALAQQLTQSFAQLQTSGIDASQLLTGDPQDNLAQRYDLLAGDRSTDTAAALAQDSSLLTQADLAGIGIDLRNEQVDGQLLQAAYAADSTGTLDALQQGTDVLAQVGAVLAQQQGALAATTAAVEADLSGGAVQIVPLSAAQMQAQLQAQVQAQTDTRILSDEENLQQLDTIAQRQLEVRQQLETEELSQGLQEAQRQQLQQAGIAQTQPQAQQQIQQQDQLQAQRIDSQRLDTQRLDTQRIDSQRIDTERQDQQQVSARMDQARLGDVRQTQLQQSQLQQQAQVAADEAVRAQLAASDAQIAASAAAERAQALASQLQLQADQGLATTAQAEQAQQNAQAQQFAAQNAGQVQPLPSSQDPSVAAAIAAYNLNNIALNPGLMNRSLPASELQKPLVAPVAPVEPVKPVPKI